MLNLDNGKQKMRQSREAFTDNNYIKFTIHKNTFLKITEINIHITLHEQYTIVY